MDPYETRHAAAPEADAALAELVEANRRLEDEIRQRRAAEESLREAQDLLHQTLQASNMALWSWNPRTMDSWVSPRYWTMLGYEPGEVDPNWENWFNAIHPDDREKMLAVSQKALTDPDSRGPNEYRLRRKDGNYNWVYSVGGLIERDEQGQPIRWTGCHLDITEFKELEQRVRQREIELAHAARIHTLGELATGLAHELNQPLAAIVTDAGTCEAVLEADGPQAAELVDEGLLQIAAAAQRAGEIMRQLQRMIRKQPAARETVDLPKLVSEAVGMVAYRTRHDGVEVTVTGPKRPLPPLLVDAVQVEQVVVNLLQNAVDAVKSCAPGKRRIQVSVLGDASSATVEVSDSGPGVPADVRHQVFDAFFSTKQEGLGIGLAISRAIVEAHGGTLACEPRLGGGARFRFTLPIRAEA